MNDMHNIKRVAIVTGGSAGIGKVICEHLLKDGCEVISLSRRHADIDHPGMHSIEVDLMDRQATLQAATEVAKKYAVNTLVHNAGVIRGALLDVDLGAIGRPVQALVSVRVRPPSREVIEEFRDWAQDLPEMLGVFVTTGTADFVLHVAVPDNDRLYAFVIDRLTQHRAVADVRTSVVFEHLRTSRVDPVP